jgi:hypothetical protein
VKTLDIRDALREADLVVLAEAESERDVRSPLAKTGESSQPAALEEVEVTLRILAVIKGTWTRAVQFSYYDSREYPQVGAPRGATGGKGSIGVFFLRRTPDGRFRSAVDVYRPDIAMQWLATRSELRACAVPSDCLANLLLTYHAGDDVDSFVYNLALSAANARRIVGFVRTFELLRRLTAPSEPSTVRQRACVELATGFPLQFPLECGALVSIATRDDVANRSARLRSALQTGGIDWIRRHMMITEDDEIKRFIETLLQSPDRETQSLAQRLFQEVH